MPRYRCCVLDKYDQVVATEQVDCRDETDVLRHAEATLVRSRLHAVEVWDGASKIFTVTEQKVAVRTA